jgi:hypothetical protein
MPWARMRRGITMMRPMPRKPMLELIAAWLPEIAAMKRGAMSAISGNEIRKLSKPPPIARIRAMIAKLARLARKTS